MLCARAETFSRTFLIGKGFPIGPWLKGSTRYGGTHLASASHCSIPLYRALESVQPVQNFADHLRAYSDNLVGGFKQHMFLVRLSRTE